MNVCARTVSGSLTVVALLQAPTARAQLAPPETGLAGVFDDAFYVGIAGGWTIPAGEVSSVTDLIDFGTSLPAKQIYDQGLAIALFGGLRTHGWLAEIDMVFRLAPVTEEGQTLINLTGPVADRDVSIEYATFEILGGRDLSIGNRLRIFGAVGAGLSLLQLSQGLGVEPFNEEGFSLSTKAGLDLLPFGSVPVMLRLTARYQILSAGVSIPHDIILQFGASYTFFKADD